MGSASALGRDDEGRAKRSTARRYSHSRLLGGTAAVDARHRLAADAGAGRRFTIAGGCSAAEAATIEADIDTADGFVDPVRTIPKPLFLAASNAAGEAAGTTILAITVASALVGSGCGNPPRQWRTYAGVGVGVAMANVVDHDVDHHLPVATTSPFIAAVGPPWQKR